MSVDSRQNKGRGLTQKLPCFFLFSYEREFMASLSYNKEAEIIQAFNSTSRYLDDLLNIDNPYVESYKPYVES